VYYTCITVDSSSTLCVVLLREKKFEWWIDLNPPVLQLFFISRDLLATRGTARESQKEREEERAREVVRGCTGSDFR
jgi:hypothetical protein